MADAIPLILLAGRDRRSTVLPEEGQGLRVLKGYKAMDVRVGGRPLLELILERLRHSGFFDPIYLVGPERVYGAVEGVRLVDADGEFGENIRAGVLAVQADGRSGFTACLTSDVLPEEDELSRLVDDIRSHQPLDFWAVECRYEAPEELGTSAWKPKYLIIPEGSSEAAVILPGHLVAADLDAIRLDLLYEIFDLAYRTRNRPTAWRRTVLVRAFLWTLIKKDLQRLVTFRLPNITWGMLWNSLVLIKKLVTTGVSHDEMADRLRRVWIRTSHRRRYPQRRGRILVADALSLARDIDTHEEAEEITAALQGDAAIQGDP